MAQAASPKAGGLQDLLKNQKVVIGVAAAVVLAIIIVVVVMMMKPPDQGPVETNGGIPGAGTSDMAGGAPGDQVNGPGMQGIPGPADGAGGAAPYGPGGGTGGMGPGGMDPTGMGGGAPASLPGAKEVPEKGLKPIVPARPNPFLETKDIKDVEKSIDPYKPPPDIGDQHRVYDELNPTPKLSMTETDENGGPPVPAMRLVGVVMGSQVSGLLQMGDQFIPIQPGKMIPDGNPTYRVDRIESDKVVLSHRWTMGEQKGVQRIEVPLASNSPAPAYGAGGGYGGGGAMAPGGYAGGGGSAGMGGPRGGKLGAMGN